MDLELEFGFRAVDIDIGLGKMFSCNFLVTEMKIFYLGLEDVKKLSNSQITVIYYSLGPH